MAIRGERGLTPIQHLSISASVQASGTRTADGENRSPANRAITDEFGVRLVGVGDERRLVDGEHDKVESEPAVTATADEL